MLYLYNSYLLANFSSILVVVQAWFKYIWLSQSHSGLKDKQFFDLAQFLNF